MLKTDIGLEAEAIKMYNEAAVTCAAEKDQISKQLLRSFLKTRKATWICLKISKITLINSGLPISQPSQVNRLRPDA